MDRWRTFGRWNAGQVDELCARDSLEGACYREVRRLVRENVAEIDRRYPKVLRRVGGYNLDALVAACAHENPAPFNMAKLMVGSEGTLGVVLEAKLALVPLPKFKAVLAIQFADLLEALEATPAILAHRPSAIEVMDGFILDHTRQSPALEKMKRTFIDGDPAALLCVELYAEAKEDLAPRLDAIERDLTTRRLGYRYHRALDAAAQSADLVRARGGTRAVDGDEGRRQVALVRRGHGGRAREASRLHRQVPADGPAGTARPPACMRTRRSGACTCGRSST